MIKSLIEDISENHTKSIVLALQETWKYDVPKLLKNELQDKYRIIHESVMNPAEPRGRGRPFGGICFIISNSVAFKIKYTNPRCLLLLLIQQNILMNNVYLQFNDSGTTVNVNLRNMEEALGHLDAAHELTDETSNYITVGDFNCAPNDSSRRQIAITNVLERHGYRISDTDRHRMIQEDS